VLVGTLRLVAQPLGGRLDSLLALHVLHNDARLDLCPNRLAKTRLPSQYADNGIEFSTLEQAIYTAGKGAGSAIVDRNMIAE
jgi:LysR family glycine cleavage system transcriptional activator